MPTSPATMLQHPVPSALLPVAALMGIGFAAGRLKLVGREAVRGLSDLVFMVLVQALLFRTMATAQPQPAALGPMLLYYALAAALFALWLWLLGAQARSAVLALAAVFSNMLMIGVPLLQLAYGQAALVQLFTLVSMHSLVVLTLATLVTELLLARERARAATAAAQGNRPQLWRTAGQAMRHALLHPIPLPILAGLAYSLTGWGLHPVVDKPLKLLGDAFSPVALVLVGLTLAHTAIGPHLGTALRLSALKTLAQPLLMWCAARALGVQGMTLTVMVLAAALPTGANVFLFAQRYGVAGDEVAATMAISTGMALCALPLWMLWLGA